MGGDSGSEDEELGGLTGGKYTRALTGVEKNRRRYRDALQDGHDGDMSEVL